MMRERKLLQLATPISMSVNSEAMVPVDKILIDTTTGYGLVKVFEQEELPSKYDLMVPPLYKCDFKIEEDALVWSVILSNIESDYVGHLCKKIPTSGWQRLVSIEIDEVLGFVRFYFTNHYAFESVFSVAKEERFDSDDVYLCHHPLPDLPTIPTLPSL